MERYYNDGPHDENDVEDVGSNPEEAVGDDENLINNNNNNDESHDLEERDSIDGNQFTTDNGHGDSEGHFIVKVRGLPWSATSEELISFFEDAKIKDGKDGIHFLLTSQGRPSGEAYVEFETTEDVTKALKKDKQYMGKRYVEVYEARYSDMTYDLKRNAPRTGTDADRCILKLRGLPFSCSKEEIAQFFTGLEIVPNGIFLISDPSGRSTGEAFVRFVSPEVATKSMEKHKERIGHRYVEIFPSSVRELEVATGVAPPPPSLFARGPPHHHHMGGYNDMGPPPPHRPTPYDRQPPPPYRGGRMKGYGDYYGGYNEPSHGYHGGYPDPYGPPPPHHHPYHSHHHHQPPPHHHHSGPYGPPGYGGRGGYMPPPPPPPPAPPSGHRVRMRGLPYSATQQDIYEFFHPMAPINVHFIYLPNGKFSGEVDAEFRSHEEATDAMRFDRKYIEKRYIELFLYSHPTSRPMDRDRGLPPPPPMPHGGRSPTSGGYAGGYQTF